MGFRAALVGLVKNGRKVWKFVFKREPAGISQEKCSARGRILQVVSPQNRAPTRPWMKTLNLIEILLSFFLTTFLARIICVLVQLCKLSFTDLTPVEFVQSRPPTIVALTQQSCSGAKLSRYPLVSWLRTQAFQQKITAMRGQAQLGTRGGTSSQQGQGSGFIYSLLGVSLVAQTAVKVNAEDELCYRIRMMMFPLNSKLTDEGDEATLSDTKLEDYDLGAFIAKGCNSAVYEARYTKHDVSLPELDGSRTQQTSISRDADGFVVVERDSCVNTGGEFSDTEYYKSHGTGEINGRSDTSYGRALKIMFNYKDDNASSVDEIMTRFRKEMVPVKFTTQMNDWMYQLPAHPNIVNMHCAFIDSFPEGLPEARELFPAALPGEHGRNHTMFLDMKRYDTTLEAFLTSNHCDTQSAMLLLSQLLEGVAHLNRCGVAHRDIKPDNILIKLDDADTPRLVLSDFGCCLVDSPTLTLDYVPDRGKGGNTRLMAPEIKNCVPNGVLDYGKSDLWAVGSLAYELFGEKNPFGKQKLDSGRYCTLDLPNLPGNCPIEVGKLISSILKADPEQRPSPAVAANALYLVLWAPESWRSSHWSVNKNDVISWLLSEVIEVLFCTMVGRVDTVRLRLKWSSLARMHVTDIMDAMNILHDCRLNSRSSTTTSTIERQSQVAQWRDTNIFARQSIA